MRTITLLLLSAAALSAQTPSVTVAGVTPQQSIVAMQTDGTSCNLQVSTDPGFSTLANDVNPALFQNADQCNRLGSTVNGHLVTAVVGSPSTATALTGDIVSRSLQANTAYYVRVVLGSGTILTTSFTTLDPPLGNSAPTPIPFNTAGYGNYGWPTLHLAQTADTFIDPQTGLQIQRVTGPNDEVWRYDNGLGLRPDALPPGWTGNCIDSNGLTTNGSGVCTYSGPGGPSTAMFVRPDYYPDDDYSANYGGTRFAPSDARIDITGSGGLLDFCVSYDHATCIGNPPYGQVSLPASTGNVNTSPNFPHSAFTSFGQNVQVRFEESRQYQDVGSVSISGNRLMWTGGALFPVTILKPGMLLQVFEGNYSNYNTYTIAGVQDSQHVTLTQPVSQSYSNPHYQLIDFGFLLWQDPASSGNVSIHSLQLDTVSSTFANTGAQGSDGNTQCGTPFALAYDASGNPYPNGQTVPAYFCSFQFQGGSPDLAKVWVPSTGETRKISVLQGVSLGDGLDPQGYLQSCSYNVNDPTYGHYKAYDDGGTNRPNPAIGCTRYPLNGSVDSLIRAAYPQVDWSWWGHPQLRSSLGGTVFVTYQVGQNQPYIGCLLQPENSSQPVSYCVLPNDPGPNRWSTSHSAGGGFLVNHGAIYIDWFDHFWSNDQNTPNGVWTIDLSSITGNTSARGTTALDAGFAQSCQSLGVTNPEWIALETSDNSCFQATVPHQPVDLAPPSGDWNPGAGTDYPQGQLTPFASSVQVGSRPGPWAHNAASCGGDGSTAHCWSYYHDYAEGDWLVDPANLSEAFLIAKSNGTQITLMRSPRYLIGQSTLQSYGAPVDHANGFQLQLVPYAVCAQSGQAGITYSAAAQKPTDGSNYLKDNPQVYGGHVDNWTTGTLDTFIDDFGYYLPDAVGGAGYGIRYGQFPSDLTNGYQFGVATFHPFAGSGAGLGISQQQVQSHSGGYTYAASPRETQWALDFQPYGGPSGGSANLWPTQTQIVSGQTSTYKVSPPATGCGAAGTSAPAPSCENDSSGALWFSTPDPKRRTTYSGAGPALLQNISGPNSQISDATPFTRCHVLLAGECVAGSQPGDEYQSVPGVNLYSGQTQIAATDYTPYLNAAGPELAWGFQYGIAGTDPFGLNWRHLTMGLAGPTRESNYANIHGNADGQWGFFTDFLGDGERADVFAVQLPPWPNVDSITRNTFIPVQVSFVPSANVQARVEWGYMENGSDISGFPYCSAERMERCTTAVPASSTDPYVWESEPQSWANCSASTPCTIMVPALSGRVMYFEIQKQTGEEIAESSVQVIAIR